jgi:hypothetical protein
VVFGWLSYNNADPEDDGTWLVSLDVARAVVTAVLPLGLPGAYDGNPHDVVVGAGGEVYVVERVTRFDGLPNQVVVRRVAADLRAVEWTQVLAAQTAAGAPGFEYSRGFQICGMVEADGRLVVAAELRFENLAAEEVDAPTFSFTGGGVNSTLTMVAPRVAGLREDVFSGNWAQDVVVAVLDKADGSLVGPPRVVGTSGLDELAENGNRGGVGRVHAVGNGVLALVGHFGGLREQDAPTVYFDLTDEGGAIGSGAGGSGAGGDGGKVGSAG